MLFFIFSEYGGQRHTISIELFYENAVILQNGEHLIFIAFFIVFGFVFGIKH